MKRPPPLMPRTWHISGCDTTKCVGAQRIDGLIQGGCVPCHCGHTLERHYQDREDEGCVECNASRIKAGAGASCRGFRSVMTADANGSSS